MIEECVDGELVLIVDIQDSTCHLFGTSICIKPILNERHLHLQCNLAVFTQDLPKAGVTKKQMRRFGPAHLLYAMNKEKLSFDGCDAGQFLPLEIF